MSDESGQFKNEKEVLTQEIRRIFYSFLNYLGKLSITSIKNIDNLCFTDQIKLLKLSGKKVLYIDFEHLLYFSEELADLIEDQYSRLENSLMKTTEEFLRNTIGKTSHQKVFKKNYFRIGFYNLPNWKTFNFIKNSNYGKLNCTLGNVIRLMEPENKLIFGIFQCSNQKCKTKVKLVQNFSEYSEPKICPKCKGSDHWELITDQSVFIEIQKIRIQEIVGKKSQKNNPLFIDAMLIDDATNLLNLGNNCVFTGHLIPVPLKKQNLIHKYLGLDTGKQNLSFNLTSGILFYPIFLVNHVFFINNRLDYYTSKKRHKSFSTKTIHFLRKKERKTFIKLRSWSNFFKRTNSLFFNSVQKYETLKVSILLMLVGGVRKSLPKNQLFRNNINISIMSPPDATLRNLYKELKILNPEIIYSNPTICSASGLTASVIRDSETTSLCLESGLLVNKNENLLFIENFHGLEYRTQKLITMCMENQEFAINKAELKLTLNSRISILGVSELLPEEANNFQFFSKTKIFEKNLLGKFDLNFFLLWNDSIDSDFSISKRIILLHNNKKIKRKNNNIWTIQLYLLFVRNMSPLITSKIYDFILRIYLFFKKLFFSKMKTWTSISSRQLETLVRLSEAFGKLTLFSKIQEFHVKAAARIMFHSFFFLKSSKPKKTNCELFLNIVSNLKKSKGIVEIKFHDSEFISRKILFLIGKKISNKKKGNHFLKFVQAFFFHFSKFHVLEIGLKQIKKLVIILKHLIKIEKKIFITKLSENLKKSDFTFFLNSI